MEINNNYDKFKSMNINSDNQVKRWTDNGELKVINQTELKNLQKGDYFIRISKPNTLCKVVFASKPYMKYIDYSTYKEEPTTQTQQIVKVVKFNVV